MNTVGDRRTQALSARQARRACRIENIAPDYLDVILKGCVQHGEISEKGTKVRDGALHHSLQTRRAALDGLGNSN